MQLVLCNGCRRHVRDGSTSCPFCGGDELASTGDTPKSTPVRWGRAAALAVGVSVAAASCAVYGGPEPSPDAGTPTDASTD